MSDIGEQCVTTKIKCVECGEGYWDILDWCPKCEHLHPRWLFSINEEQSKEERLKEIDEERKKQRIEDFNIIFMEEASVMVRKIKRMHPNWDKKTIIEFLHDGIDYMVMLP